MFKPVTDFSQYDDETVQLYAKRENDPRLSYALSVMVRKGRNQLPVYVDGTNNEYLQKLEKQRSNFGFNLAMYATIFTFACFRFTKAYYPYGIIIRRSIPTTNLRQASYYGPMVAFFGYAWWMHKEYPRKQKSDLTCDSEN